MTLFEDRGYNDTTIADIARAAGLTKRTFFRYFADKREVLFAGSALLQERMVSAVAGAPRSLAPLDAAGVGVEAAASVLEQRREYARRRQAIIAANAELQERELIKLASLAAAVAETLRARGVPEPAASLAAEIAIAVFRIAFERWIDDAGERDFPALMRESLEEARGLTRAG